MRLAARSSLLALLVAWTLVPAGTAHADALQDLDDRLQAVTNGLVEAAIRFGEDDVVASQAAYDQAAADARQAETLAGQQAAVALLGRRARRVGGKARKLATRLEARRDKVYDATRPPRRRLKLLRSFARTAQKAERPLRGDGVLGFGVFERRRSASGFHAPGSVVTFEFRAGTKSDGSPCDEAPVVVVESASNDPLAAPHAAGRPDAGHTDLGNGRFTVELGDDVGGVRVRVTACGVTRERLLYNLGPRGVLDVEPLRTLSYGSVPASIRGGRPIELTATYATGIPDEASVAPPLPDGLVLDPATGTITGSATGDSRSASYTVTARNARGSATATLTFEVTPALPPEVEELADGFVIEPYALGLAVPSKIALAPDGRLFFNELLDGNVRVIAADGSLVQQPFATVAVQIGGERGLLGIALAPDFETSGHVFVYATVPAAGMKPVRNQIIRFTAVGNTGTAPTVIVDDLPAGDLSNAGGLAFGPVDGMLYVTVGDTGDETLAQADGSRAGRVLRFTPDGAIPADNPIPNDAEWCRGLRNSFDLTFHAPTGGLFATENGPTAHDELNFIIKGKNYEWGAEPESIPGFETGARLNDWTPVIVPTGLTFHSGTQFGPQYADNLFVCAYDEAEVLRLPMSGPAFTDIDAELDFLRFDNDGGVANKPLDILELPDGSLLVSTFSAVWRIFRY